VGLYRKDGPYWYTGGVNPVGLVALLAGIAPCVPGFLGTIEVLNVGAFWMELYNYAWFLSFGVAFVVYAVLTGLTGGTQPEAEKKWA
jgi:NCS1 family nucleobase:cation symporter-1